MKNYKPTNWAIWKKWINPQKHINQQNETGRNRKFEQTCNDKEIKLVIKNLPINQIRVNSLL